MDSVSLDQQIIFDEFSRVGVVGMNAAYLGGCQNHVVGFLDCKKSLYRRLIAQIQFGMGACDKVVVSFGL